MKGGLWTRETVAALLLAAYLPVASFWLWIGGVAAFGQLGLVALVIGIWHLIFMLLRAQPPSLAAIVTALAIAMLAPEDLGVWRLSLGISFGVVMGELVFGGWGRNVVNPATVTLAFLGFGFPTFDWPGFDAPVAWAAIPAAVLGAALGVLPAALIAGAVVVGALAGAVGLISDPVLFAAGIVLVLLVADPVASAATTVGRWINGALYSGLVILFATYWTGAAPVQMAVSAALLASLAAPLLDEAALAIWISQRRRRHGRT